MPIELAFDAVSQMTLALDENFDNTHITKLAELYATYVFNLWEASYRLVRSIVHGTHDMYKQERITNMLFLRSVATIR